MITVTRFWTLFFLSWGIGISGIIPSVSPGFLQLKQIQSLVETKNHQIETLQTEIGYLDQEIGQLLKSKVAQRREIRRVLGFLEKNEILFDFGSLARP